MFTTEKLSAEEPEFGPRLRGKRQADGRSSPPALTAASKAAKQGKVVVKSGGGREGQGRGAVDKATPEKPRLDYVFIMGEDSARRRRSTPSTRKPEKYFRVHYPKAELIIDERTLDGVLAYIDRNIEAPIGHLYIVSHGNQDGTLQFGSRRQRHGARSREAEEPARRLPPQPDGSCATRCIRPGGGKSTLRDVSAKIDGKTTIHIRGCDLGQNKEFVNLIDEAFGGKGQVIASTHEQVYGTDSELAKRARAKAKKDIEDSEPMPPPVDPGIKDKAAKRTAMQAREKALKERQGAHQSEAEGPEGRHRRSGGAGRSPTRPCRASSCSGPATASSREEESEGRDRTPLPASRQEAARRASSPASSAGREWRSRTFPRFRGERAHQLRPGLSVFAQRVEEGVVRARSQEGRRDHHDEAGRTARKRRTYRILRRRRGRTSEVTVVGHSGQRRHGPARGQNRLAESAGIHVGGQARSHRREA